MSNQDLNNLSIEELKKIKKQQKSQLKKEFKDYKLLKEKQKLIDEITGIQKVREKIRKPKT